MTFLNQIFYSCNKFDNANSIEKLNSYMLTNTNYKNISESLLEIKPQIEPVIEISSPVIHNTPILLDAHVLPIAKREIKKEINREIKRETNRETNRETKKEIKTPQNLGIFYPQKTNSLFWCAYISHHGMNDFQIIGTKYQNKELEEKQKMIEFIKKNPQKLKASNHKVTNILIQELLSGLMIEKKSFLQDCIVYSIFYNKDIYIVKNSVYLFYNNKESETVSTENTVIIYCKNEKEYGIEMEVSAEKVFDITNAKIRIFTIEKPLKSLTEYKTPDLERMATILAIPYGKKKDMYNSIVEKCNWNI